MPSPPASAMRPRPTGTRCWPPAWAAPGEASGCQRCRRRMGRFWPGRRVTRATRAGMPRPVSSSRNRLAMVASTSAAGTGVPATSSAARASRSMVQGRIEPQRLAHHGPGPGQPGHIRGVRVAVPQHRLQFLLQPLPGRGVGRQQRQRPGQRVRARLVTGQQERGHLVTESHRRSAACRPQPALPAAHPAGHQVPQRTRRRPGGPRSAGVPGPRRLRQRPRPARGSAHRPGWIPGRQPRIPVQRVTQHPRHKPRRLPAARTRHPTAGYLHTHAIHHLASSGCTTMK